MGSHALTNSRAKRPSSLPAYLYQKRGIFYFRCGIPKAVTLDAPRQEIRISLRTGYRKEALKMAGQLHSELMAYLERTVSKRNKTEAERLKFREALREQVRALVDNMLKEPNKRPLPARDVRLRLNGYLKHLLDEDSRTPMPLPDISIIEEGRAPKEIPIDTFYEEDAKEIVNQVNTFEGIENWFPIAILELIDKKIFSKEEITEENSIFLAKSYQILQSTFAKIKAARIRGDFDYEQPFFSADEIPYPPNNEERTCEKKTSNEKKSIKLSELIEKYTSTQIKDKQWKEHTLIDHQDRLCNIIDILGDRDINNISRVDMRNMRDTLLALPPHRKRKPEFRNKTIEELLAIKHEKTLSVKRVNIIIEAISTMFKWAIQEEILEKNPAVGLSLTNEISAIDARDILSTADIKKVFFSGDYTPERFKNPAYYWAPLIGLYTGMRLEEICQLYCEDIYQEDGIWIIDIRSELNDGRIVKKVKTKNAKRKIPIHPDLISLGLIDYLKNISKDNERLFPLLKTSDKTTKYGKQVGKHFSKLLKEKQIIGKKTFHSLRHTFANFFKIRELHNDIFRQVFGHEIPNLAGNTYGERFSSKICYESIISKLHFI